MCRTVALSCTLRPCFLDLIQSHDLQTRSSVRVLCDAVSCFDLRAVDVLDLLLMLHDRLQSSCRIDRVDEDVAFVDDVRYWLFLDLASALCECNSTEITALKRKLISIDKKVTLLFVD